MNAEVLVNCEQELLIWKNGDSELKYRVFQIYGQRFIRILDSPRRPDKMSEVYVVNIPRNISIETLFKFFIRCGEIYQIRILMDYSGCNRGRCFVQYQGAAASREAICVLHDEIIESDHRVSIKLSLNNNQLILKSIPGWITEEQMEEIVRRNIGEGLSEVTMKPSKIPYKNYCFCTYSDHQFAIMAHKKAWPFFTIQGYVIDVQWAIPQLLRHEANLYFTNFPDDMTKKEFFDILVTKLKVSSLVQFRFANYFGFITLVNSTYLMKAQKALKNLTIRGCTLRFSRIPFLGNGVDRNTSQYYETRTVLPPLPQTSPLLFPAYYPLMPAVQYAPDVTHMPNTALFSTTQQHQCISYYEESQIFQL